MRLGSRRSSSLRVLARRRTRTPVAAVALAVYAALPLLGVVAGVSHGASHALEALRALEAKAAAHGLVHAHDARTPGHHAPPAARYVHEHGGVAHAHGPATGTLLAAADASDSERSDASAPTPVKLAQHLPAVRQGLPADDAPRRATAHDLEDPDALLSFPPLLPPPRA